MSAELADFWDDLLECIEDKRVIPILGPELLTVTIDGKPANLYQLVAERLAERLRLPPPEAGEATTLNNVVRRCLQARGRREELYPKIRNIMKELQVAPPEALVKLARIRNFDLYVSLTFDSLLADALTQARLGGMAACEHLAFAPNKTQDLPAERAKLTRPLVYGLLGKLSAAPDYVITEEDTLEFLYAMQSEAKRPHLLFDELQNSHLLIIGCAFPDWLARFFIRIAKSRQLSMQRSETEIFVHEHASSDRNLVLFLQSFSYSTKLFPCRADAFVDELYERWIKRHPEQPATAAAAPAAAEPVAADGDMAAGAVFVSYAKEDLQAVQSLQRTLEGMGLDVWFDKDRLEAGDQYDAKIKRNIKGCSLFIPVISRNTERRLEGYFRREWSLAIERAQGISDNVPFILPVVIDDTPEYSETVPERFRQAQWTRLPAGSVTPDFESRMVKIVRDFRKRERGYA
jgi:hypothetical protein